MFPTFKNNLLQSTKQNHRRINTEHNDKSFHIETQTFYSNNFKKIKPAAFQLKQNHHQSIKILPNHRISSPWFSNKKYSPKKKQKTLQKMLRTHKGTFQQSINQSLKQINKSFNRYIVDKIQQHQKLTIQRKKSLSCKNLLKQLQQMNSAKKLNLPLVSIHQKNLLEMANDTNYQISNMESNCLDTMFPFQRYGHAISSYQGQLLLYGGFTCNKKPLISYFHKYNIQKRLWSKVEQVSKPIPIIPCFHTIDVYKNYMILVGGMSITSGGEKRKYNSDICVFNFDKKQWFKLRASLTIRSHASTLFGNTLLIHGGVDDKDNNSNQMHFINFTAGSIQNSIILSTDNRQTPNSPFKHSLTHHKLVNTNQVDSSLKVLLKYDGVFCFGGVNNDGQMHNEITFLNCIGKQNALDVRFQTWIHVQLSAKGPKPQPRKNHSFNIINKKALILLIGGQNIQGRVLNDMWVFDLIKLQWKQINPLANPISQIFSDEPLNKSTKLQEGISGHCAAFMGSRLFIFGGRKEAQNKKQHCLWSIETDLVNNLSRKLKIEKSSNNSVNTIKDSTKQESMWNIEF